MTIHHQKPSLVIFCKRPKLNQGKQRLAQDIDAQNVLTIAEALLACAIEDAKHWQGPVVFACAHKEDIEWAESLDINAQVMEQLPSNQTGNLGERINYVDHQLRQSGHQRLVFIGTDAPMLTQKHYYEIEQALNDHDIALSHAEDGGVVIMANKSPWPSLKHLPWSTTNLSLSLSQLCLSHNLSSTYIVPGYDVDYFEDIKKLIIDLQADQRPARQALLTIIYQLTQFPKVTTYA